MISADAIRGYIDIMILSILRGRPSYAYELAKTIGELSDGQYNIKQTTLYSAVKRLETSGWVESFPASRSPENNERIINSPRLETTVSSPSARNGRRQNPSSTAS